MANTKNIEQIYDSQLDMQKTQITEDYNKAISDLDASKKAAKEQLDKNLNTTAVESQRAQKNYNEVQNAYGLSSGAMAQARLAQDNQLQADMTTLRTAHATEDAELERQRTLLGQQYASAIQQAQSQNDIAKAEALYAEAQREEEKLTAKQEAAAALMAQAGDFSLYQSILGLTDEQVALLNGTAGGTKKSETQADGSQVSGPGWTKSEIEAFQGRMGINKDGVWGTESQAALDKRNEEIVDWVDSLWNITENQGGDPYAFIDRSPDLHTDYEREFAKAVLREYEK